MISTFIPKEMPNSGKLERRERRSEDEILSQLSPSLANVSISEEKTVLHLRAFQLHWQGIVATEGMLNSLKISEPTELLV